MGMNNGLFGLLVSMWITCHSPSLPPPLDGNNGEALLHIVICTEEVFQRDPTVPDRLRPVNPFALAQVLEDLTRIGDLSSLLRDWVQIRCWKVLEPI
jgi:hypothetical protein